MTVDGPRCANSNGGYWEAYYKKDVSVTPSATWFPPTVESVPLYSTQRCSGLFCTFASSLFMCSQLGCGRAALKISSKITCFTPNEQHEHRNLLSPTFWPTLRQNKKASINEYTNGCN